MNITLVGHLCKDVIHIPKEEGGEEVHAFGGIMYSLLTLANLASPSDSIAPVFGVAHADYDEILDILSRYPAIERSGVYATNEPTNQVHLFYEPNGQRIECSKDISRPIPFETIKPFLSTDGVFINMVSGFDITLETLDSIRMSTRDRGIPIHFDFHSLTLGVDPQGKRFRRPLSDWRRWCFMLNSVQMSEVEMRGLTPERLDEKALINQLMPLMVNALIITRGERGVTLIEQSHKKLTRHDIPGVPVHALDPTGCGDVFAAAFLYHVVHGESFPAAAQRANAVAAWKASFSGFQGLDQIKQEFSLSIHQ
jgi:sugar/nucleoside kinase (ribokinase family)